MIDLIAWYNNVEKEAKISPLEIAALFHYRYIRIHPFEDGNGRIARLLVNYILARHGYPMIVVHDSDRNGYLGALGQCDAETGLVPAVGAYAKLEQITPLVNYLEQCLKRALVISIKAAKGESIEDEDDMQKRLAILARNARTKFVISPPVEPPTKNKSGFTCSVTGKLSIWAFSGSSNIANKGFFATWESRICAITD